MTHYRIAIVTSHPIQYQAPLFRLLSQHSEIDLTVYFGHDASLNDAVDPGFGIPITWDMPLLSGYHSVILKQNVNSFEDRGTNKQYSRLLGYLRRDRYDAVLIHGYASSLVRWAHISAWYNRVPVLLHSESESFGQRSRAKQIARASYVLPFLHGSSAFLAIGSANYQFYRLHGVPSKKIFKVPYAVDNSFFQSEYARLLPMRDELRRKWGFSPDQPVIVFSGKLIERKRPLDLLAAYRQIRLTGINAGLLYIGDGELRSQLEAEIAQYGLEDVKIVGFKNQSEISSVYICGDVFVLPSRFDTWGLVVNEAMNFEMPVIVSDKVGAGYDLVKEDKTGYVFSLGDVTGLSKTLIKILRDREKQAAMGKAARRLIDEFSFDVDVSGIIDALNTVVYPSNH